MGNLTAAKIAAILPAARVQIIAHGNGLALRVTAFNADLFWRYRYRWAGKQTDISLGEYNPKSPDHISIKSAEERAYELRKKLEAGVKPFAYWAAQKLENKKSSNTFESVAREWLQQHRKLVAAQTATIIEGRVNRLLLPKLGSFDIAQLTGPDIRDVLKQVAAETPEIGKRLRMYVSQIIAHAVNERYIKHNISLDIGKLPRSPKVKHRASLKEDELPEFFDRLKALDAYPINKLAMLFIMLTAVRTNELRFGLKEQLSLSGDNPLWRIPAEIMKMEREHIVPLAPQAVHILQQANELYPNAKILFPSGASQSGRFSENCLLCMTYKMGYHGKCTIHGMRGLFSTTLREHGFNDLHIEKQLAHEDRNSVRAAYNAAQYISQRRVMMNWWDDYLQNNGLDLRAIV